MLMDAHNETNFSLEKLKRVNGGGLYIEYESKVSEGNETFYINDKKTSPVEPDDDLLNKVRVLKTYLLEIYGFENVKKIVNDKGFKATEPQKKAAEKGYLSISNDVEITGFSVHGKEGNKNIIINGKLTIQKLGVVALNTPRIKFSSNIYGWEDKLEELIDSIKTETYLYLFESKRAQLTMFGADEQKEGTTEIPKETKKRKKGEAQPQLQTD